MNNLMQRLYFDAIESGHCNRKPLTKEELALIKGEINLTDVLRGMRQDRNSVETEIKEREKMNIEQLKEKIEDFLLSTDDSESNEYAEGLLDGIEVAQGDKEIVDILESLDVMEKAHENG